MNESLPSWVRETAPWPLAFAQVREDPLLDGEIVAQCGASARVLMIASGGCTAAHLLANHNLNRLHLVDANPAQLALTRLKLHLFRFPFERRQAILGHRPMSATERRTALAAFLAELSLPDDILGPSDWIAAIGPDFAGRYERIFAELQSALRPVQAEMDALLRLRDPDEQAQRSRPGTKLGDALDQALDEVMALPILVALFGEGATRNRVLPFSRHFAQRTRHALATLPAADNPYLWQMYRGAYPPNHEPQPRGGAFESARPNISWSNATMNAALGEVDETFDFVHLSNILDWLFPDEARTTLDLAARVLAPGGRVLIRQLNSALDIPAMGAAFDWLPSEVMHRRDRSFFYRALHVGRKR
jgi:S-adenosylmethionine-diacylglycerol 3-amino-3-carboxypropyl transferase